MSVHTGFPKNAKVYIQFKDGSSLVTKWLPKERDDRVRTTAGTFKIKKIQFISYACPKKSQHHQIDRKRS